MKRDADKVLCFGLTPVLQRTLMFDALELDEVNRATHVVESAAGKALNTARALSILGTPVCVAGFNGGPTGKKVNAFLAQYGVDSVQTPMSASTRICTTLLDRRSGCVTELVEEAPAPDPETVARFVKANLKRVRVARMLVLSGTLPPFAGDDFYVPFVRVASAAGVPVVIDSHKAALIQVLFERPLVAKLTVREMETTLGESCRNERTIVRAMRDLMHLGAQNVFVTQGPRPAYLLTPTQLWRYQPSAIRQPLNPIGSGDCTTAGLVHALLSGKNLQEAVRFGLACGSANVESLTPADLDLKRVQACFKTTRCEREAGRAETPLQSRRLTHRAN